MFKKIKIKIKHFLLLQAVNGNQSFTCWQDISALAYNAINEFVQNNGTCVKNKLIFLIYIKVFSPSVNIYI